MYVSPIKLKSIEYGFVEDGFLILVILRLRVEGEDGKIHYIIVWLNFNLQINAC